jgi:cellulose synthase/poly-beta-1,6-N-acetylglucosamine synthase-like glycosyltransferase
MALVVIATGVARYLIGGILLLTNPGAGSTKDYTLRPSVAVLLPCFNESKAVYATIESVHRSDYPHLEIVAVNDGSTDDSWEWIQKAAIDFPNVRAINQKNGGKTKAIFAAFDACDAELVLVVDSDTLVGINAVSEAVANFGNPKLGAVGAPVGVRNPNDNALTAFQTYLYYLGFRLGKMMEVAVGNTGCIGGFFLMVKRTVMNEIRPDLEARNWFGIKIRDGEDRYATHQILLRGYDTYIDMKCECTTFVPTTFKAYWGQQVRWRRSNTRDFFYTIARIPMHVRKLHPMGSFVYVMTPLVMFIGLIGIAAIFFLSPDIWLNPEMCIVYIGASFLIIWLLRKTHPDQQLHNPLRLFVYAGWWLANNLFLTIYALLTFDSGDWGNRTSNFTEEKHESQGS